MGQSAEVKQLLLNVEKLAELRGILEQMKKGYKVVKQGYSAVSSISRGNFELHKYFLDGLLEVSSGVRGYYRIPQIARFQAHLLRECKSQVISGAGYAVFSPQEIQYLHKVLAGVLSKSLRNLEDLLSVLSEGLLQMSDAERLSEIDRIYSQMQDLVGFVGQFKSTAAQLSASRIRQRHSVEKLRTIYGIKTDKVGGNYE